MLLIYIFISNDVIIAQLKCQHVHKSLLQGNIKDEIILNRLKFVKLWAVIFFFIAKSNCNI